MPHEQDVVLGKGLKSLSERSGSKLSGNTEEFPHRT